MRWGWSSRVLVRLVAGRSLWGVRLFLVSSSGKGVLMLLCEKNTESVGRRVKSSFRRLVEGHPGAVPHFEHGQWWVSCLCGASWSVVDAEGPDTWGGIGFEQISDGEEDYH